MKRVLVFVLVLTGLSVARSATDPVSDWNATAVTVMTHVPTLARSILQDLVYVHVAIYDAVNAIDGKNSIFAVSPSNVLPGVLPGASQEAAVAAAARRVLLTFYPSQQAYIDSVYRDYVAGLPPTPPTYYGTLCGDDVAKTYLGIRVGDGREAVVTYTWQSAGAGVYQPTPPGAAQYQPVGMFTAQMRTFVMDSASQLRAPAPPAISGTLYARDFNEVKKYGSRDSSFTSPEQREIARFHTENPNLFLTRNIREIAKQIVNTKTMSIADYARYYAQLYLTIGDAQITGFNSKYFYNCWRPVTAIRAADADGNPATEQDTSWMPLVTTPTHPEYPAAHGTAIGGLVFGLQEFLGTSNLNVSLKSNATGTTHLFATTDVLVREVINARVWGGMHFRTSVEAGMAIARKVADVVARRFKPVMTSPFLFVQRAPGLSPSVNPEVLFSAVDERTCWGVKQSNNQFIRTINGGITWTTSTVQGATGLAGSSITAFDANTAWVVMYDPSNATSGGVFKTTDGGATWTKQLGAFPGFGGHPDHIHFFDPNNGVVIGNPRGGNWEIYTTTDGGAQWTEVPSANIPPARTGEFSLEGLFAASGNRVWFGAVAGGNNGVYRSFDRGMTWSVTRNLPGGDAACVAFKDSLNGLVGGPFLHDYNVIDRTTDGGVTWTAVQNVPSAVSAYFISYIPGTRGSYMITSTSNIGFPKSTLPGSAYSTDDGNTWTVADQQPHGRAVFASNGMGWAAGNNDVIYYWDLSTGVKKTSEVAEGFRLEQNYPNPFNPKTEVRFQVPGASDVKLVVYDILGREVAVLVNEKKAAGTYEASFDATGLASGVYIYRLTAGSFVQSRKMILLK